MARLEKIVISTIAIILALLLVLLGFQALLPGRQVKISQIAVLVEDFDNEYWKDFKHGAERACLDYSSEFSFGLFSTSPADDISRAVDAGADALVISAKPGGAAERWLDSHPDFGVPVVTVGYRPASRARAPHVGADDYQIGRRVGESITDSPGKLQARGVTVVADRLTIESSPRYRGLLDYLNNSSLEYSITVSFSDSAVFTPPFETPSSMLLVSLDHETVDALCDYLDRYKTSYGNYKIVGADYSAKSLLFMEKGIVLSLVAQSQYALGYAGINTAASLAGNAQIRAGNWGVFVATKENMYGSLAPILFPIYYPAY